MSLLSSGGSKSLDNTPICTPTVNPEQRELLHRGRGHISKINPGSDCSMKTSSSDLNPSNATLRARIESSEVKRLQSVAAVKLCLKDDDNTGCKTRTLTKNLGTGSSTWVRT